MNYTMYDIFMGTNGYPGPGVMATVPILMEMTAGGILVDRKVCAEWTEKLRKELHTELLAWNEKFAPINPLSTPQMKKLLYDEWGLPIQRNKEDGVTTDELACVNLRQIVAETPRNKKYLWQNDPRCTPEMFDLVLRIRAVNKNLSTYADVKLHGDGRIHPGYLPESKDAETADGKKRKGAAATGRLASRDPNIQNQPKIARLMYIPDDLSMCIVQHDYKSAELYVTAAVSGDPVLWDDLRSGDIHTRNSVRIGCERRTAKAVIYGTNYGAGAQKISDTIKKDDGVYISAAECKRVQDGIARTYHVMWAYRQVIASLCVNEGYVVNPFGRIRWYYNGAGDITSAYDYVPQSTVADVVWCVLRDVAACARKYGGRLLTTVHDSIVACIPAENVPAYAVEAKAIMERRFHNVAPDFFIPVDVEASAPGKSWGELQKLEVA